MIKRILVPLDPSKYCESALSVAIAMAKRNDSELTGMVVLDIKGIEKSIGPVPAGAMYYAEKLEEKRRKESEKHISQLLDKFKNRCDKEGVKHTQAHSQGEPSQQITGYSRFYDMVVMGLRTYYNFDDDEKSESLDEILDEGIATIYGIPEKLKLPEEETERVRSVICFDGSLPSSRALQRYAQFAIPGMMDTVLLNSNVNESDGKHLLEQAEMYLKAHGLEKIRKVWSSHNITRALEEEWLDWCHMVVVGAHSKKIFDFMVGSLTKYLIANEEKPVLIAQ